MLSSTCEYILFGAVCIRASAVGEMGNVVKAVTHGLSNMGTQENSTQSWNNLKTLIEDNDEIVLNDHLVFDTTGDASNTIETFYSWPTKTGKLKLRLKEILDSNKKEGRSYMYMDFKAPGRLEVTGTTGLIFTGRKYDSSKFQPYKRPKETRKTANDEYYGLPDPKTSVEIAGQSLLRKYLH